MTMSHLDVAIAACEDFECGFKGAGPKEAMNGHFQPGAGYFVNRKGRIELVISHYFVFQCLYAQPCRCI